MGTEGFETFYGERSPSDRTYTKSPPSSFKNRNFFNSFSKFLCYKQEKQINSCTYIWLGFFQTFAFLLPSLPSLPSLIDSHVGEKEMETICEEK